ncbi:unnamed protein product [Rotaria sordida]|uniref:Co-chaperone DjlA N-terminal domain-containing protein n=1 Tax=Rotaria sordida TaxID=392033 RepID=A0A820A5N5_9BILA|nr:unnamed protein product [Rotaria sordida]
MDSSTINERTAKWMWKAMRDQEILISQAKEGASEWYSKLLANVAGADGTFSPPERHWIIGNRAAFGASEKLLTELEKYEPSADELEQLLSDKYKQYIPLVNRITIYESFQAASADGELHAAERKAITKVAAKLGVEESIVKQIEEIHDEEVKLKKRRHALLFADGGIKKALDMAMNL